MNHALAYSAPPVWPFVFHGQSLVLLVPPMGGGAKFRLAVHVQASNLDLEDGTAVVFDRSVEAPIAAGLGMSDVVFEAKQLRMEMVVHQAQRAITVRGVGQDDSKRDDVLDLIEFEIFGLHFSPDTGHTLDPLLNLQMIESVRFQRIPDLGFDVFHPRRQLRGLKIQGVLQSVERFRVERAHGCSL